MSVYLDASVVVAFLAEPNGHLVRQWLAAQSAKAVVSTWVDTEVSGALARKRRMGLLTSERETAARSLWYVAQASLLRLVSVSSADFRVAAQLCARHELNLRGADALHLAIVQREGLVLATFDRGMAEAARQIGLPLEALVAK